jgi:hypothetical protein
MGATQAFKEARNVAPAKRRRNPAALIYFTPQPKVAAKAHPICVVAP